MTDDRWRMLDDGRQMMDDGLDGKAGQVPSELSAEGTKRDVGDYLHCTRAQSVSWPDNLV